MARGTTNPLIPAADARRLLMSAQGLLDDPSRPTSPASLYKLIERMGFVQLDTISIVERAHHHILHSRLDRYQPTHLETLHHHKRLLFEHVTHDASLIPVKWFPHWRPRFDRRGTSEWWPARLGSQIEAKAATILSHIRDTGPRMAREFESTSTTKVGTWWDWRPEKIALEYLCNRGDLCVLSRDKFQKVYELTERVYPEAHAHPAPSEAEHIEWACSTALDRLGIATPFEIAAFWKSIPHAKATAWCNAAEKSGRIRAVLVEDPSAAPKKAFALPDFKRRLARAPQPPSRIRLLSPFDPVIRDRKRLLRLFNFDYRFEAFVPAAKRKYGYYVLPILEGDRIIGRLDPKLDRDRATLHIRGLWWEPGITTTRARTTALEAALDRFSAFIGAHTWKLPPRRTLRRAPRP